MRYVTSTELKNNLSYYLELSNTEDVFVTKNNNVISVITNADTHRMNLVKKIRGAFGTFDQDIDYKKLIADEVVDKNVHSR